MAVSYTHLDVYKRQNYNSVTNIHVCKRVMGEVEKLFRDDKF